VILGFVHDAGNGVRSSLLLTSCSLTVASHDSIWHWD
jgi:hypothetical protein